jgi:DNA-binding LacI/PurR family transcriptional regulator
VKKTIIDVAKELNLAPSTISKIVNNKGRISEATRERVLKYVESSGYVAMSSARKLSSKKSFSIGVIYSDISLVGFEHPFFSRILQSFKTHVESQGYEIVMIVSKLGRNELTYLEWCQNKKVDGVLIVMGNINNPNIIEVVNSNYPVVSTDIEMKNLHTVICDDRKGVHLMVDYAKKHELKNVAIVTGPLTSRSFNIRVLEFRSYMNQQNMSYDESDIFITKGFSSDDGAAIALEILSRPKRPEIIFVLSDVIAFGLIRALEASGVKVPEDVEVIGYDDIDFTKHFVPSLSTIKQDTQLMGKTAAKILLDYINQEKNNHEEVTLIPVELIERETTRKK